MEYWERENVHELSLLFPFDFDCARYTRMTTILLALLSLASSPVPSSIFWCSHLHTAACRWSMHMIEIDGTSTTTFCSWFCIWFSNLGKPKSNSVSIEWCATMLFSRKGLFYYFSIGCIKAASDSDRSSSSDSVLVWSDYFSTVPTKNWCGKKCALQPLVIITNQLTLQMSRMTTSHEKHSKE